MASPATPGGSQVQICLEGLPQVCAWVRAHTEHDLQADVAQAFGFRSTADFEVPLLAGVGAAAGTPSASLPQGTMLEVKVRSVALQEEVACLHRLFAERPDLGNEIVYAELARATAVPLLRLHRAIAPTCGAVIGDWFEAYLDELEQVAGLRDRELRRAASLRVWKELKARVHAVFPNLIESFPEQLQMPALGTTPQERVEFCSRLFSRILDEARLRLLPLRMRRSIANSAPDFTRPQPGSKRLLRVCFQAPVERRGRRHSHSRRRRGGDGDVTSSDEDNDSSGGDGAADSDSQPRRSSGATTSEEDGTVFLAVLDVCPSSAAGGASSSRGEGRHVGFTGHELYYQVAKFFGEAHVQVKTRDGTLVSLEKPHEPLLGQLPCSTDGLCIDLVASRYRPRPGSFDQLYREVLRILGPRHFKLDQSYRLQLSNTEESLTTTQGIAVITTVILIPVNFLDGRQMYLFRSPRYRQCKAVLRTFDEFREMLQALVQVYNLVSNAMSPAQAERLRSVAEGPGQTPLAPFDGAPRGGSGSGPRCVPRRWGAVRGCTQAAGSAMGLLGGLHVRGLGEVDGSLPLPLWRGAREDRRIFDCYGLDVVLETWLARGAQWVKAAEGYFGGTSSAPWWSGCHSSSGAGSKSSALEHAGSRYPIADPWSIAIGGLIGVVFGLLEGVYERTNDCSIYGADKECAAVIEKMARRGAVGLGVSAIFHFFGRLLRLCLPDGRYTTMSKKSVPASQAVVFLGTAAWAFSAHFRYVEPRVVRRLLSQDLNLAERQAAGIILKSGLACTFTVSGYLLGAHVLGGSLGGPAGAFAGSLMPIVITLFLTGLDWWQDRTRRRQMKAAALQTLGLPEPGEHGVHVFKPMLSARYRYLACYLHPDKNDSSRCDTTTVFSQVRLAREILEQELKDYENCPRERLRRLFEQMLALCGYRRDRYVSDFPSGVIMYILEDGPVEDPRHAGLGQLDHRGDPSHHGTDHGDDASSRTSLDSITTVESRSVVHTPTSSPRVSRASSRSRDHEVPCVTMHPARGGSAEELSAEGSSHTSVRVGTDHPDQTGGAGGTEPWVVVPAPGSPLAGDRGGSQPPPPSTVAGGGEADS